MTLPTKVSVTDVADLVIGPNVLLAGKQREPGQAERCEALGTGQEARLSLRQTHRELPEGAEAVRRAGLVVRLDHDAFVGELGLEMDGLAARRAEGAGERTPVGAVGVNGPDAPLLVAAQALRFQRAEHHPAVLEGDGMEGAAEVHRPDQLDVAAVVVHDEQLHGGLGLLADAAIAIAIADEHDLAAGHGAGGQVVDAARMRFGPLGYDPGVGRALPGG